MPQCSLVHVLLWWVGVLSVVQVVFIVFYSVSGHHREFHNCSAVASEPMKLQKNQIPSVPTERGLLSDAGIMLSFQAAEVPEDSHRIKWVATTPDTRPVSEGEVLSIKKDGYYYVSLQVALCSCSRKHLVSVRLNGRAFLQGWTHNWTCSTGLLAKADVLSARWELEVTVEPQSCINITESVTHLDIIYMHKP